MKPACGDCRFFSILEDGFTPRVGECRRREPVVLPGMHTMWPRLSQTMWCGEFRPKEAE